MIFLKGRFKQLNQTPQYYYFLPSRFNKSNLIMPLKLIYQSIIALSFVSFISCRQSTPADLIIFNADIYTLDSTMSSATAVAIVDGRFVAVGSDEDVLRLKGSMTEVINANKAFIMPGLIEGHGHFAGMGQQLLNLDFLKDTSWNQIVEKVQKAANNAQPGEWITGRGWHQEKWTEIESTTVNGYPIHEKLSAVTPNNPVILYHASGHSLFANKKAMELAGMNKETSSPVGGVIVKSNQGEAIGVFEERAMNIIQAPFRSYREKLSVQQEEAIWYRGIHLAQEKCLHYGITSFQDAGTSFIELERYRKMAEKGELKIRLWAMIRENMDSLLANKDRLPVINAGNGFFTCNAVKSELDGALGVFGAWKLKPYTDKPGYYGQNTTSIETLKAMAAFSVDKKMQLCVHAIGDRANKEFLNICEELFNKWPDGVNARWRSEHAQHIDTSDIARFPALGILASMQGIHCTSDAPFVVKRLGLDRSRTGAYAWRSLLDNGVRINNGTDVPVESINPFECLYASISRKRIGEKQAFFPEQAMTRTEAIYSYTMANAYAAFEEKEKGSISVGKMADFIWLDKNILTCDEEQIPFIKVTKTYLGGKCLYTDDN
jgi:predicted amidohydrolase YtcJ